LKFLLWNFSFWKSKRLTKLSHPTAYKFVGRYIKGTERERMPETRKEVIKILVDLTTLTSSSFFQSLEKVILQI